MPQLDRLSKSRFLTGRQCELRLWHYYFSPDLGTDLDDATLARMAAGDDVGELARQRFPGALVAADRDHMEEALAETARLVRDPAVNAIHEGAFEYQGTLVRVDVLLRRGDGAWDIIEVKSTKTVKDVHLMDASFQRWVVGNSGLPLGNTSLMVLNGDYRYQGGALDLEKLFRLEDISALAEANAPLIEKEVGRFQAMIRQPEAPKVQPSPHCFDPYDCPYFGDCTRHWPKSPDPVEWLPNYGPVKWMKCHNEGIHGMLDVPLDRLTEKQRQVRDCHASKQAWVSDGLAAALNVLQFPIHFLDFETLSTAVPKLIGSGPYNPTPFQWSCHTLYENGELAHADYLAEDNSNPRELLFQSLLEVLGKEGSICVYSHFEKGVLNSAIQAMPHHADEFRGLIKRLVDLHPVVKNHVYLPTFYGSFSIKEVLPALVPGFTYSDLQIQDGVMAGNVFARMLDEQDASVRQSLRKDLLTYCGLDTLAMVKIREALLGLI
jgi:hypothetical protein